ncbi:MAG: alpha/beta hydrolase, partial [Eubacteriales bacterium]|nr:alpha/beta hydrolase [Eubacteriales bacterium]
KDIDLLIEFTQGEYPDLPIFLYGHSMGGNITLDYRKRGFHRTVPHRYIVTSPWIILQRKIPGYLSLFSEMMAMVKPDFLMNSEIKDETLGNQDIIEKQMNHHLRHGKISVKTALEGIETGKALLENSLEIRGEGPLKPFLLMQGTADVVCDPEGSRILAQQEKELCSYIEWEGLYHEIHNGSPSSDGMAVIRAMMDWIRGSR